MKYIPIRSFNLSLVCSGVVLAILLISCTRKHNEQEAGTLPSGTRIGKYVVTNVQDGGSLNGVISVSGDVDGMIARIGKRYVTNGQAECMEDSKEKPQQKLLLHDGHLKNVVVSLVNCDSGRSPAVGDPVLDQRHCDFIPHVLALMTGDSLGIVNSDPIIHSTHGYIGIHTVFNIATPTKDEKNYIHLPKEGTIRCICDAGHPWMEAYIHILPNPYFAITDADGSFSISDIPPGTYTVQYSHELWNDTTTTITIPPHGSIDASQTFDVKNIREQ
ncbi:MAG TPA: carboxypeptidase regulatory-like domain-containing protein [Candidatus Kapabacteria bacterium]|nr:carboxypeptidase regulatory-like domain-containing protein [Candidatus Kapabacteria bacterium]